LAARKVDDWDGMMVEKMVARKVAYWAGATALSSVAKLVRPRVAK